MFCSRCGTQVDTSSRFCPSCGLDLSTITGAGQGQTARMAAPPEDEASIVRDALKDEYELEKELGRGGMAIVFKARDKQLEREVAIKVLPFSLSFDAEFVERFQREARTAGKLEHPNIIPIYRVGRNGRVIYFVMKFIRGKSLSAVIESRGAIPVPEIRRLLIECSRALGYAHKHGIVHRDIKPDNIMFDELGQAIVTDFGIAKAQSGARLTGTGMSIGTPHYMSPEQARAQNLDGRSDVYSLGVVAYQGLTGHVPFDGEDSFSIGYKHIMEELPVPPLESAEQRELFAVIQKMMAKKPDDRFQTAEDLIVALEGAGAAAPADLATMPTRAIEPMKPPPAKGAAPAVASAATSPLPRASASMGRPAEAAAPAAPAPPRPPRPAPAPKKERGSRLPLAIAATLGVVAIGLGGYYYVGVLQPSQARAALVADSLRRDSLRQDSVRRAQLALADTARRDTAAAGTDTTRAAEPARPAAQPAPARPTATPTREPPAPVASGEGTISIAFRGTVPPNPRITVDGQPQPRTRFKVPAGVPHSVRVEADGYRPYTNRRVTVAANATQTLTVELQAVAAAPPARPPAADPPAATVNCESPSISLSNPGNACWDRRPEPRVPPRLQVPATCTGTTSRVVLRVQVSAAGEVMGSPAVVQRSSCETFTQQARAFVLDMTFRPAEKAGRPVSAWYNLTVQPITP
jgi:serine/threonine-protein kinase